MKIPIVIPVVRVNVRDDGRLTLAIDDETYDAGRPFARTDLRDVLDDITRDLETALRVEITEADGTTYVDIVVPATPSPSPSGDIPAAPGVAGSGFQPGEQVAVAMVLSRHTAEADGTTHLRLPAALAARNVSDLVLIGLESGVTTTSRAPT